MAEPKMLFYRDAGKLTRLNTKSTAEAASKIGG